MTKLAILTAKERHRFDSPPVFTPDSRAFYFSLAQEELNLVQALRTPTNKLCFVLQLGYFKANGKFFSAGQFRLEDISYVAKTLELPLEQIDLSLYQKKIPHDHRQRILKHLCWQPLNATQKKHLTTYAAWLIERQLSTKQVFLSAIDFCWQNKVELLSYNTLALIITDSYNQFEQGLINVLSSKLTPHHQGMLNQLVNTGEDPNKKPLQKSRFTLLKKSNQSLRPTDIQENIEAFQILKKHFMVFKPILDALKLSDQASEYFATWVQKSTAFQLSQFPNKNKLYLHMLCYIKHQFYCQHDTLIDIFLKAVLMVKNSANHKIDQLEKISRPKRNKAIKQLSTVHKDSRALIDKVTDILKSPILSESGKLAEIEYLVNEYNAQQGPSSKSSLLELEQTLDNISQHQTFFNALESMSLKLQRRVSNIVKVLEFNTDTSSKYLIEAISCFQTSDGQVNQHSPRNFLNIDEKEAMQTGEKQHVSLYKILLFSHMADGIKSGDLNLRYSYRYKAIQEYLIDQETWQSQREFLLISAGLHKFADFQATMDTLKQQLDHKYQTLNERFLKGENKHLQIEKDGHIKIATPKIDSDDSGYVFSLLSKSGFVPILQVLTDIHRMTGYASAFKHSSVKHTKMKPQLETIFAGIIGKGCNIGVNRIANISVGISEDILKNTVNWCFSQKNIQEANHKILHLTNKLFLANAYRHDPSQIHTGSDGRKISVAVDSLLASYSFKYFGKGKGVTIYVFLDERQLLFHSTVISSSGREAAYVIDGLVQNDVIQSNIHSTDTHGFTETVFAATHFMDIAFAPRIKRIAEQTLYAFSAKQTYEKRGYKILPSRIIDVKLMENHWDDILRFMANIKLKHASASQLFKRLSSYAKNHSLYRALKEFGRIIKSIFILTYFDDVELRQRIEKQLNKVELSNKFSKAVFFANNQEFQQGVKEEQVISTACKVLIQNAIVLWNYLYLSQLLANNTNFEERDRMVELIKKGSVMTWQHINLQGEYDFTKPAANDTPFDMEKILALKFA